MTDIKHWVFKNGNLSQKEGECPVHLNPIALIIKSGAVVYGDKNSFIKSTGAVLKNNTAGGPDLSQKKATYVSRMGINIESDLRTYELKDYQLRRKYCDSALGMHMLDDIYFTSRVLNLMALQIEKKIKPILNQNLKEEVKPGKKVGRHLANPKSFGRLDKDPGGMKEAGEGLIELLKDSTGDIPKFMALVDVFYELYIINTDAIYNHHKSPAARAQSLGLRDGWFDSDEKDGRGRNPVDKSKYKEVRIPGILPFGKERTLGEVALDRAGVPNRGTGNYAANSQNNPGTSAGKMYRQRGIDMFERNGELNSDYAKDLNKFGLNFSASASGTTSTLIAAAQEMAPLVIRDSENYKEYIAACVGYLVGGGMHTCHEVFFTAGKMKFADTPVSPYHTSFYDHMLPKKFLDSPKGKRWKNEFSDVRRAGIRGYPQ